MEKIFEMLINFKEETPVLFLSGNYFWIENRRGRRLACGPIVE